MNGERYRIIHIYWYFVHIEIKKYSRVYLKSDNCKTMIIFKIFIVLYPNNFVFFSNKENNRLRIFLNRNYVVKRCDRIFNKTKNKRSHNESNSENNLHLI